MQSCGIPMDSYLMPMDSYGFLWIPVGIPMDSYRIQPAQPAQRWICSIPLDSYTIIVGSSRFPMDAFGFL